MPLERYPFSQKYSAQDSRSLQPEIVGIRLVAWVKSSKKGKGRASSWKQNTFKFFFEFHNAHASMKRIKFLQTIEMLACQEIIRIDRSTFFLYQSHLDITELLFINKNYSFRDYQHFCIKYYRYALNIYQLILISKNIG